MSVCAKNSQFVLRAHLVLDIFYENPASPLYMHIFLFFSLIVALIWRKTCSKKGPLSCKDLNPGLLPSSSLFYPLIQSSRLSRTFIIQYVRFCYYFILCNACLQSIELGQNKTKKTRFERDLFLICSLWHYIILFLNKF